MTMKTHIDTSGPLDAPPWFTERCEELSRLMSSTPKSVADGLWLELVKRNMVTPAIPPGRVLGPLGWKQPEENQTSRTMTGASRG
jgi:hypothetical protein